MSIYSTFQRTYLSLLLGIAFCISWNDSSAQIIPRPISFDGSESLSFAADTRLDFGASGTIELLIQAPHKKADHQSTKRAVQAATDQFGAFSLIANASTDSIRFAVLINAAYNRIGLYDGQRFESVPFTFKDGKMHHVALVTENNSTSIIIDTCKIGTINMGYGVATTLPLHIGSLDGTVLGFAGDIYLARLWDRPLTVNELRLNRSKIYGAPTNDAGLVAYSLFTDVSGQFVYTQDKIYWPGLIGGKGELNGQIDHLDISSLKVWTGPDGIQQLSIDTKEKQANGTWRTVTKLIPPNGQAKGAPKEFKLKKNDEITGFIGTHDARSIKSLVFLTDGDEKTSSLFGLRATKDATPFAVNIPPAASLASLYYTYTKAGKLTGLSLGYKEADTVRYQDLGMWRYAETPGGFIPVRDDVLAKKEARAIDPRDFSIHLHGTYTTHPVYRLQLDKKTQDLIITGDDLTNWERQRLPVMGSFGTARNNSLFRGPGFIRLSPQPDGRYRFEDELVLTIDHVNQITVQPGSTLLRPGAYSRTQPYPAYADVDSDKLQWGATFTLDQRPRKLEYNFKGFNIAHLDPIDLQLTTGTSRNVFKLPAEDSHNYHYTSAGKIVPNGLIYRGDREAINQARTSMIENDQAYQEAWNFNLGMNIGIPGASFGANFSHQESMQRASETKKSLSLTLAQEVKYALVLDRSRMELDDDFRQAILDLRDAGLLLPFDEYQKAIDNFIITYGTHYPYAVTYGGMAYLTKRWSQEEISKAQESGSSASAEASGTIEGVTVGGNIGGGSSSSIKTGAGSEQSGYRLGTIGGEISMGAEGGGWSLPEGAEVPVFLDLRPISDLFSPLYFEDASIWTALRAIVDTRLKAYERKFKWSTTSWVQPPPIPAPVPIATQLKTDDDSDLIITVTKPASYPDNKFLEGRNMVRVRLVVEEGGDGWWKGMGFNQENPTIEGAEQGGAQSATIPADLAYVTFWKAKVFGVHTKVGEQNLDFSTLAGYEVTFTWKKE